MHLESIDTQYCGMKTKKLAMLKQVEHIENAWPCIPPAPGTNHKHD